MFQNLTSTPQSFEIIVHPRCTHTIYEMEHYSYRIDPVTDEVTNVLGDKDNHICDSLRYSCEAIRRTLKAKTKPNFVPLPNKNFWS